MHAYGIRNWSVIIVVIHRKLGKIQPLERWQKIVDSGDKVTYLCLDLLHTICERNQLYSFYQPCLLATPSNARSIDLCVASTAHDQAKLKDCLLIKLSTLHFVYTMAITFMQCTWDIMCSKEQAMFKQLLTLVDGQAIVKEG